MVRSSRLPLPVWKRHLVTQGLCSQSYVCFEICDEKEGMVTLLKSPVFSNKNKDSTQTDVA
jgi:hypothetical protein